MYKILDAHCHIYPDKIAQKASDATGKFYDMVPLMDGTVSTLISEGEKAGFSHFVVQSVATTPHQVSSINRFVSEIVKNSGGKMTGLGTVHPDSENQEADILELISLGLKGVKLHPDIQNFKMDDYRMLKIYELCEKHKLPVLMHCGDSRFDRSNPNRLVPILDIYTDLIVIGAHFGGYSVWEDAIQKLSEYKNFYVDTSSSLFAVSRDDAKRFINAYGVDKVMFGTDYPLWSPKEEIERFMRLDLSEEERRKILFDNAARLLGIE
ncbi:MAG: amidohydrolase [Clostridia bacterium]|nr:amidohydrolase [Clostridia bacterium]MBP3359878.1 amidohydrolase [Clostridia bacterium]